MARKRGAEDVATEWSATKRHVSKLVASLLVSQERLKPSKRLLDEDHSAGVERPLKRRAVKSAGDSDSAPDVDPHLKNRSLHSAKHSKRRLDEDDSTDGENPPLKRRAIKTAGDSDSTPGEDVDPRLKSRSLHSAMHSKRRLDEDDSADGDEPPPKRRTLKSVGDSDSALDGDDSYANLEPPTGDRANFTQRRMDLREVFEGCDWKAYRRIINLFGANAWMIALALIDSPEELRLKALEKMKDDRRTQILDEMTNIETNQKKFDPFNIFPSVVTRELVSRLQLQTVFCLICDYEFEDGEDVIWKNCKKHLMHTYCFGKMFENGLMPLFGPCPCIGNPEVEIDESAE